MSSSRLYAANLTLKRTIIAFLAAFWMTLGIAASAQNTVFSFVPSITTIAGNGSYGSSGNGSATSG